MEIEFNPKWDKKEFKDPEPETPDTKEKQLEFVAQRLERGETINPDAAAYLAHWVRKAMEPTTLTTMEQDCMEALRVFHLYAPAIKGMPWMKNIHKVGVQALGAGAVQMAADAYEAYKHRLLDAYSPEEQAIIMKKPIDPLTLTGLAQPGYPSGYFIEVDKDGNACATFPPDMLDKEKLS